ncbi:MAG: hypothetical protein AUG49_06795 [Catenulispora sp. 13_1_20CM_3_70_7]|nr:MAG: hypothetical protein AUG49_06795 [Catenulispora sp. 13_1_20CM_3_70_7]
MRTAALAGAEHRSRNKCARTGVFVHCQDPQAEQGERFAGKIVKVVRDDDVCASREGCRDVVAIVRVTAWRFVHEVCVGVFRNARVAEESSDHRCHLRGALGGSLTLADDDAFPFVQQEVGPDEFVYLVLGKGQ